MKNMNATSGYDLKYKGLSAEDSSRLSEDVKTVLMKGSEEAKGFLASEVAKAVEAMYSKLYCNPWPDIIAENANDYEMLTALQADIWKAMLKTKISEVGKWRVGELIAAWKENHPEDFASAIGADVAEKIQKLTTDLEWERRMNREARGNY